MRNRRSFQILTVLLCLCMVFSSCRTVPAETTGATTGPEQTTAPEKVTFTVQVQTEGGMPLEAVGVYVYTDSTLEELVWFDRTDAQGMMSFSEMDAEGFVAVLNNVPEGYVLQEQYVLTGQQTTIILPPDEEQELDLSQITYHLGDPMQDFTVTACDGTEYTLSELLQSKKAVVLNFFYNECAPCKTEFPYLQEAYTQYASDIAVLGMNPVNQDDAAIAQLQSDLGITFPLAQCSADWNKAMQLQGYPTTVIVDRFGTIALIHMGSIPDAKTFKDAFAFFTAEDYTQTTVEDISSLVTDEPDNPADISGMSEVELTLLPGQSLSYDVYKLNDMILRVNGKGMRVTYGGKDYEEKDGTVSLSVSCPDNYTPVNITFANTSEETVVYQVSFLFKSGSWNNPYRLSLGEFSQKLSAGNDSGVYYRYTAPADGEFTLKCLESTPGVKYALIIYNLDSSAYITLEYDVQTDEEGNPFLTAKVKKGQKLSISMASLPDDNNSIPALTMKLLAEFTDGQEEEEEEQIPMAVYRVSITDTDGSPMPSVRVKVEGESFSEVWTTDENGAAQKELPAGAYTATVTVPADYTAEVTSAQLTAETTEVRFVLDPVVITHLDYTVTLLDPQGAAVPGATVIIGEVFGTTDENGTVSVNLETGDYSVYISGLPAYLLTDVPSYSFPEESSSLEITLVYKPGCEFAPIAVDALPFETESLKGEEGLYYILPLEEKMLLTVRDADAYIIYNGVTYGAVNDVVSVEVEQTGLATVVIGNGGTEAESYTVSLLPPVGTEGNPKEVSSLEEVKAALEAGVGAYWFVWTAPSNGKLTFTVDSLTENVSGQLTVTNSTTGEQLQLDAEAPIPEETVPEETVPEETVPEETVPEETIPEETVPEETVPEETVPEETVPEETIPEETVPEETVPEETVPEETVPEETVPEETVPEETIPEETVPEETVPEETVPEETVPEETVPEETIPEETVPEETVPEETVPEETIPEETIPEETVPEITIPEETVPEETIPEETIPEETIPEETIPEETIPEETVPEETVPEETVPEETIPEETIPEETIPEETVPEETIPEETVPEETVPEETIPEETVPEETVPEETIPEETIPEETVPEETVPEEIVDTMDVAKGDVIVICLRVCPDENGNIPAAELLASALWEPEEAPDDPDDPEQPEESKTAVYTITVTDYARNPAANVMLAVYGAEGELVTTAITDADGKVSIQLTRGSYTVSLLGSTAYYEKTKAVLTANDTELLILLASEPDPEKTDFVFACDGEFAYSLGEGGTHVVCGSGQMGYSTEYDATFFVFAPERPGIYRITTSNPEAVIGYYNTSTFIYNATANLEDYADNAFTRTVQEGNLGIAYILGISGSAECILEITWLGEPGFDPNYMPYTSYEGTWTPTAFTYKGGELTDVDVVNGLAEDCVLVYNETDGLYHLGAEDGPVMYARLTGSDARLSLDLMINGDGVAGGAPFRSVYYDDYGVIHKEDYTALILAYLDAMSAGTEVYPLTQDLYYMLRRGVEFHGWATPGNGNYLFGEDTTNPDISWMFLLCHE